MVYVVITARVRSTREGNVLTPVYLSTLSGGVPGPGRGGVPGLRFSGAGTQVSDFRGGRVPGLRFSGGGSQVSNF